MEKQTKKFIVLILLSLAFLLGITSCASNGYGCKGRSKIITRVR